MEVTPFPGPSCPATFTTAIQKLDENYKLTVKDTIFACADQSVDLTSPAITAGSSPMQYFQFFTDSSGQNFLSDPKLVTQSGIYYIMGINKFGCSQIKPVTVILVPAPQVTVNLPWPVCAPATIDITQTIAERNDPKYRIAYFTDPACTLPIINPANIKVSTTCYVSVIDITKPFRCPTIVKIPVIVKEAPITKPYTVEQCRPANITIGEQQQQNNSPHLAYSYWANSAATIPIDPTNITLSAIYYIKGTNANDCYSVSPITVDVRDVPVFKVDNPVPVTFPLTVNLERVFQSGSGIDLKFSYWQDSLCTVPVEDPTHVMQSGTYYIKGSNGSCALMKAIVVTVNPPSPAGFIAPNTFTPNGDGINDFFSPVPQEVVKLSYLKIFNRYGEQVFGTTILSKKWDGLINGKPVPVGTYYWVYKCLDIYSNKIIIKSGHITIIR